MRTLTPDPLLQHRVRYPWFTNTHFQTFRLHPPHAPLLRQCFWLRADLAPRFTFPAIGGSSDFAHCSQSHQSHKAVSSSCHRRYFACSSTDYPFTSSCSPRPVARTQLLSVVWREAPPKRDFHPPVRAGSQAHERTTPSCEFKFSFGSREESLRHGNALTGTTESCAPLLSVFPSDSVCSVLRSSSARSNPGGIGRGRPRSLSDSEFKNEH